MPHFEETRVLPCSAEDIFGVVMDIEAYPDFLPWVADASILSQDGHELKAELVAELAGSRHPFKTVDRCIPGKLVEIRLLDGPFRFLESIWSFEAVSEHSCRVHFSIEFEFRNRLLGMVATPVFGAASKSMVQAFETRVLQLRGQA